MAFAGVGMGFAKAACFDGGCGGAGAAPKRTEVPRVASLRVLGIVLNVEGSTDATMAHCEREAWAVWHRRHTFLLSRLVPARERAARLHRTVVASALDGAGSATSRRKLGLSK